MNGFEIPMVNFLGAEVAVAAGAAVSWACVGTGAAVVAVVPQDVSTIERTVTSVIRNITDFLDMLFFSCDPTNVNLDGWFTANQSIF
jgi:hypothetical protein